MYFDDADKFFLAKNPCYPNPCSNDGHCNIVDEHFECHCAVGFKGEKCQGKLKILLTVPSS